MENLAEIPTYWYAVGALVAFIVVRVIQTRGTDKGILDFGSKKSGSKKK